jgi:CDP-glycerol glycerophosphotransferase (TagB/SpsB family)
MSLILNKFKFSFNIILKLIVGFFIPKLIVLFKIKKDPALVLFGAMNGLLYGDNSRHIFEWVLQNCPDIRPVWITNSKAVYNLLKREAKPVALARSWKGIRYLALARIGVFTNSLRDLAFNSYLVPSTLPLIALRHGKSVKRVRFARLESKMAITEENERHRETQMIRYAISTSEFVSDIQEECLQIGRQKHIVTGYPRNDVLLHPTEGMKKYWKDYLRELSPKMVILYGPSWRHGIEPTRFFPFDDFDQGYLIDYLKSKGILLLLRPHINDLRTYPEVRDFLEDLASYSEVIKIASHRIFPDVNMLLPYVGGLITDYSSLYHDYLLLDRPMIFIPYDYEVFARQLGFLYDYFEYLPGPAICSLKELCEHLDQIQKGEDIYQEKRRVLRDMVHTYQDSYSCERVVGLIGKVLEENNDFSTN